MKSCRVFGQRYCTYCGKNTMYYIIMDNAPIGICDCGNTDWCDHETESDVKKRYGIRLKPADIDILYVK